MKIIVWNIQKINQAKAKEYAPVIGGTIQGIVGDEPFVFVILENKTSPDKVMNSIGTGLNWAHQSIPLGGRTTVKENGLVFSGNGAKFSARVYEGWRQRFDIECKKLHAEQKDHALAVQFAQNELHGDRGGRRDSRVAAADANLFLNADAFRDPLEIEVRANDGPPITLLALHAPGPDDGLKDHDTAYAEVYAKSVLESVGSSTSLVLGDFNLRTTYSHTESGLVDVGVLTGATTKGREEGRHTRSRLDRVYARKGTPVRTELFTDGPERDLTDHHAMVVTLEKREQRLMTDYFAYVPSPVRRQEIRSANRDPVRKRKHEDITPDGADA